MELLTENINTFVFSEWGLVFVSVTLLVSLLSIYQQSKQNKKQLKNIKTLQQEMRALANAAIGVGSRVLLIERTQRKGSMTAHDDNNKQSSEPYSNGLKNNLNHLSNIEYYNNPNQPYEQAIRMSETGATVEDIVNVCGLSQPEAELVHMMHRLDKAS
ncbi:MAG: DUF2802 domain-containing protein [Woeseiaceae bacterium]